MDRELRVRHLRMKACQRGLLEAELVLRPFAERRLSQLSDKDLDQFEILVNLQDLDFWEVLTGRREAPQGVQEHFVKEIRVFLRTISS